MEKKKKYIKFTIKEGIFKTRKILIKEDHYYNLHTMTDELIKKQMIFLEGSYYNISQIIKITTI
jgi:hypothetical protein